jgi:hypothetical protein
LALTENSVMRRHFLVDEIMLDGLSGETRGVVVLDRYTELIESIDCQEFRFRIDATDAPTDLSDLQQQLAEEIVQRVLESDSELASGGTTYFASAAHFSPSRESAAVLSKYLAQPRARQQQSASSQPASSQSANSQSANSQPASSQPASSKHAS